MSTRRPVKQISIGTRFWLDNTLWTVVMLTGSAVTCRNSIHESAVISVTEVLEHATWEEDDAEDASGAQPATDNLSTTVGAPVTESARKRITAVNLLTTGYEDGILDTDKDPHPVYGPQNGETLGKRIAAYAAENNITERSIKSWLSKARKDGAAALIDKRAVPIKRPLGNCPREIAEAFHAVINDREGQSDTTDTMLLLRVKQHVRATHGEDFPLPSLRTLRRYHEQFKEFYGLNVGTKTRKGYALAPERSGAPIVLSRPFELVEIDTWSWDGFVADDFNGKATTLELTVALDVFTRSIVAWRVAPKATKGVDAALLLHDMLAPKSWDPAWGDLARWRYGVPERLLLPAGCEDVKLAGVPFGPATTLSLDNGKVYVSETMKSAAMKLGITLQYGRKNTPTDKPHVEQLFSTIAENFVQGLPGYKGDRLENRGTDIDTSNLLFISEIDALFGEWVVKYYQNTAHSSLYHPANPSRKMSPNQWFDASIAATGFLTVPQDPDLLISLLPAATCSVNSTGFTLNHLQYDSDDLNPYRKVKSPFEGGTWPVRYDPRNASFVFFWAGDTQMPTVGEWIRVPARVARHIGAFTSGHLEYAKRAFLSGQTAPFQDRTEALEATMRDLFERVEGSGFVNKREEKLFQRAASHLALHEADFGAYDPREDDPSDGTIADESTTDDDDSIDIDAIEPFKIAGVPDATAVGGEK